MHPDQSKINQIFVKVKSKSNIPTMITELTSVVQKDIKATAESAAHQAYFDELKGCLNSSLDKVTDPSLKSELKSHITSFMASQQKGGAPKGAQY